MNEKLTVQTKINSPIEKAWEYYNSPEHIVLWNSPSNDWHTPKAENNLKAGGTFLYRMEAKDGSSGFDFEGTYDEVIDFRLIKYTMSDNRQVEITMDGDNSTTTVTVSFDPEDENPLDFQQAGWQAILDNFKKYVESN